MNQLIVQWNVSYLLTIYDLSRHGSQYFHINSDKLVKHNIHTTGRFFVFMAFGLEVWLEAQ